MELCHAHGKWISEYDALPPMVRTETFMWWQAKIERDRALNETAKQEQAEAARNAQASQRARPRRR